ncbi:MAG: hypothetical protein ABRQ25_07270 [Clostridiaceae bacterium]
MDRREKILLGAFLIFIIIAFKSCYYNNAHFAGKGTYFEAGINIIKGKSYDLVIHSLNGKKVENISYEVNTLSGIYAKGTMSLDNDGYYIGEVLRPIIENKLETITLKLKWEGGEEIIKLKYVN